MTPAPRGPGLTRLLPGGCATVTVTYRPRNLGPDTGHPHPRHATTPTAPSQDVPLAATGGAPRAPGLPPPRAPAPPGRPAAQPGQPLAVPFPTTTPRRHPPPARSRWRTWASKPSAVSPGALDPGPGDPAFAFDPADLGATGDLAPGQGIQATLRFTPGAEGHHRATATVATGDPAQGGVPLDLAGDGDGPKLCADPLPTEDFGTVALGQSVTRTITLTDCGTAPLTVTGLLALDGAGHGPSTVFALGPGAPAVPVPLAAGATAAVPVTFTPDAGGPFHGSLRLTTPDTVVPSATVALVGEGNAPPACQLQVATTALDFGRHRPGPTGDPDPGPGQRRAARLHRGHRRDHGRGRRALHPDRHPRAPALHPGAGGDRPTRAHLRSRRRHLARRRHPHPRRRWAPRPRWR